MGSILAGVKAGVIAGLAYVGTIAVFNVAVLYVLKTDVLNYITNNFSQVCSPVSTVNGASIESCFDSLAPVYVPFVAFVGFFLTLGYSTIFGRFYERIPGRNHSFKGLFVAPVVAINLVLFQLVGFTFERSATEGVIAVLTVSTITYGLLLGKLYARYTRVVSFVSQDESALRIIVDRSDFTGKAMTLAKNSTHSVEARVADDSSFRGWTVSGGVSVEDPKSFETSIEVNGNGLLKGQVSKKY